MVCVVIICFWFLLSLPRCSIFFCFPKCSYCILIFFLFFFNISVSIWIFSLWDRKRVRFIFLEKMPARGRPRRRQTDWKYCEVSPILNWPDRFLSPYTVRNEEMGVCVSFCSAESMSPPPYPARRPRTPHQRLISPGATGREIVHIYRVILDNDPQDSVKWPNLILNKRLIWC